MKIEKLFDITGRVCVITGGGGLLGRIFAASVLEGGGIPVLLDIAQQAIDDSVDALKREFGSKIIFHSFLCDITSLEQISIVKNRLLECFGKIDILVNNAANNPKMENDAENIFRVSFTNMPLAIWNIDLAVGLTGTFLCSQIFGAVMEKQGSGVIVNIASDYGIIAPDQRIYKRDKYPEEDPIIKPVSYSVVKHGIIGITKYLASYWGNVGIRVNTLCPASVNNGQPLEFVKKISELIPLGRMSEPNEFKAAMLFLISDASSYMTGSTILLDGGRTII